MSKEILVIFWIGLMAFWGTQNSVKRIEYEGNREVVRYLPWFSILVLLPLIIWAGFRTGQGYADTNAYIFMYNNLPDNIPELRTYLSGMEKDVGFYAFAGMIKLIFGKSYRPFLLIIAVIQGSSLIYFYRKYSESYVLSIALFTMAGEYLGWMMNGIRQFLAVTIIYFAIPWLMEKKYVRFILIVLLAATIHQTALIMIPIVFIVQGKPWNKKTLFIIGIALITLFATNQFTDILDVALEDTVYSANLSEMATQSGTNPLRVAVYSVPALISLVGRKQIEAKNNRIINVAVNMSIITMALSIIGMMTRGVMLGRLPIYTGLFNYVLLPYEINHIFNEESAKVLRIVMIVLYLGFYYYLMHFAYGRI